MSGINWFLVVYIAIMLLWAAVMALDSYLDRRAQRRRLTSINTPLSIEVDRWRRGVFVPRRLRSVPCRSHTRGAPLTCWHGRRPVRAGMRLSVRAGMRLSVRAEKGD